MLDNQVGQALKQVREAQGQSQEQLAAMTNLSPITISRIENGARTSLATLQDLAQALGCQLVIEFKPINSKQ